VTQSVSQTEHEEDYEYNGENIHCRLMATATAAAATPATPGGAAGRSGGASGAGCGEDGKLDGGFFAGTFGAGDFLLLVDDDFFEVRFAIVANIFVDGHRVSSLTGLLQKIERFFHFQLSLSENALQNRQREVETIVPRNCYPQMRLLRMTYLRVTPRLMMNLKASPQQSTQNLPRFQNGQTRRHSGTDRYAKLFRPNRRLIGNGFAVLAETLQMNTDGIGGHLSGFAERAAVSGQAR
jgi:hypothetical protein